MINDNENIGDKDFFKYPNIETFKLKLAELRNIDLRNANKTEIKKTLLSCLTVLPSLFGKYSIETFNNFKFYRVRLNINESNETEDLSLLRTYSYPLPQFCKENGRANLKHKSVFYASNSALTSIIECKPKVGDTGYLSVWTGCTDREMKVGVPLPRDLYKENEWYLLALDIFEYANKHFDKVTRGKSNYFHETFNFIASLFLLEKEPYPLTSWISNELIYGSSWKDLIIYPSFTNKALTSNFAIHPNVVDRYLRFVKVIRFKVLEINETNLTLSPVRVGEIIKNNIEWRKATDEELDISMLPF
jgi:hypothetical protein